MSGRPPANAPSVDVVGADANNLRAVDVAFPLGGITVVTGVSGSGKSSLLADTLAAEGSRRTRTFLGASQRELERDDVRAFVGATPPTVLVGQRGFRPSVRTTIGTATGFLSVLRRLFVSSSVPFSRRAGAEVPPPSPASYAGWIAAHYRGGAEVWAVPVRGEPTDGVAAVARLASHGIERVVISSSKDPARLRESGRTVDARAFRALSPNVPRTIEALVGVIEVRGESQAAPLRELLERAFMAGDGSVVVMLSASGDPYLAGPYGRRLDTGRHWVHPGDPAVYARPSVHLLSFNAPGHEESGACPACGGTGVARRLNEAALVPFPERSMAGGAFAIWTEKNYKYVNVQHATVEGLRGMRGFSPDVPWEELHASARALVLEGSGGEPVFDVGPSGRRFGEGRPFPGFRRVILEKAAAQSGASVRLAPYVEDGPCDACGGTRWSPQARALRVGGRGVAEILAMAFADAEAFTAPSGAFAAAVPPKARPLVGALHRHARSIVSVGLGYLTGDRGMLEVSEGESRRVRLARVLDAGERGLCFLLDEPARGLHEADLPQLAAALGRLRGVHTVVLNEHRERLWGTADWFVEVGPGAGASGGEVTYEGPDLARAGEEGPLRTSRPPDKGGPMVAIRGASIHNVEGLDCEIPLGRLTSICGVSGSGKSSFVRGVLAPALTAETEEGTTFAIAGGRWGSVDGARAVGEVVALDQSMPPANRRSLVATFAGVFDEIRKAFASSPDAKRDGLTHTDFSVNAGEGRCPVCLGVGEVEDEGVWSVCPSCGGSRYGRAALSVRVGGVNVQELLDTPVERLGGRADTFGIPWPLLEAMDSLGIGYVALGRRVDTLSGGEVQRLRLAMKLGAPSAGPAFFILDEPAVGLHARDVRRVVSALERALDGGRNTVVMIEHDLQLVRSSDWVLEFGPGSGPEGGHIVFAGSPSRLAEADTPTGRALAGRLPAQRPTRGPRPPVPVAEATPREREARAQALVRALVSGEAAEAPGSDGSAVEPVVVLTERLWGGRDVWEVGGLDLEVPKLLLDLQRPPGGGVLYELLAKWEGEQDGWLAIQPFLSEMQVWGAALPRSVVRSVSSHVTREGMRLVLTTGVSVPGGVDVRRVRATGGRFVPDGDGAEERLRALRDALAVGARYVELRDGGGRLLAVATDRLLDVDRAVVAPMAPVPPHFSRLDPRGRCPACEGRRVVQALSEPLVIGRRDVPPDDERFLTAEAAGVMKGVLRNELRPFLRRLETEGLWAPGTPYGELEPEGLELILFGFWSRPGPGSFLKKPSANRSVGASWLRWDGLYRHVLGQAHRSRASGWARRLKESAHPRRCPRCGGSGLRPYAGLLMVGDVPFTDWVALGRPDRMLEHLRGLHPRTPRQRRTLRRVLDCLSPLGEPGAQGAAAAVAARAVEGFTTMEALDLRSLDET